MLDIIYITEEKYSSNEYSPDFILTGKMANTGPAVQKKETASTAVTVLTTLSPLILPAGLLLNAFNTSSALNSIVSQNTTDDKERLEAAQRELAAYINHHSRTKALAVQEGYKFQPGHPLVGKAYRRHPLADYPETEVKNLYIPSDSYDAILLEERESELLKLLIDLGAIKITITKKSSNDSKDSLSGGIKVDAGPIGGGGIKASTESKNNHESLDTREFILSGKPWKTDDKIDRKKFYWLPYESSWKAVVFARETGGCLSASLEIKESTSFSTDKNMEIAVKAKITEVNGNIAAKASGTEERVYLIRAEFSALHEETRSAEAS